MTTKLLENCACGKCTSTVPARGAKRVTVAEATAMVKATCEKLAKGVTGATEPERTVVGLFLSPRTPDGKGYARNDKVGGVEKVVRVGPKAARQYMPIAKQDASPVAPDNAPGSTPPGPTLPDELKALYAELKDLIRVAEDPATSDADRARAEIRFSAVRSRIEQIEVALHPAPRAGEPATAGQAKLWAAPHPHFQLSDAKRSEYEAEATALKAKIAAPGIKAGQRIRLEQDLAKIEQLLGLDARPTADPRPYQERRVQG